MVAWVPRCGDGARARLYSQRFARTHSAGSEPAGEKVHKKVLV
jgi:hypothetical protein